MGTSNLHFKIKEATNVISNGWEVLVDNQTAQLEFAYCSKQIATGTV